MFFVSNQNISTNSRIKPVLPEQAGYGFIPGLDGLRALSVLIVIIAHMGYEHIVPGGFGVTVFFFISGFLITRLLLAENTAQGTVKLGRFYARRFIRLYPALLYMIFLSSALYIAMGYGRPSAIELAAGIGYFTNIFQVQSHIHGVEPFMPWTHLWSLAVEEHFYLGFPLLLLLFRKNTKRLAFALGAIIVAAAIWRSYIAFGTHIPAAEYNYMMTDARIDSLAWGCLLSVILHNLGDAKKLSWLIGLIPSALATIGILASFLIRDDSFRYTLRFSLQGLSIFVLVLNLYYWRFLGFAFTILDFKPIAWLGSISYALYLWHVPILDLAVRTFGDALDVRVLAVMASILMAAFSFYMVEKPFIALRRKFGSHAGTIKPSDHSPAHPGLARLQKLEHS